MSSYENFENMKNTVETGGNLLTWGSCWNSPKKKRMSTFSECKIKIINNHYHNVCATLDGAKKIR